MINILTSALAYIDPGTGAMFLQWILAGIFGFFLFFRRTIFGFFKKSDAPDQAEEAMDESATDEEEQNHKS